jgi:GGDEF domain-containing protein
MTNRRNESSKLPPETHSPEDIKDTDKEDAALVADNLRTIIQAEPLRAGGHRIPLTMTFGLCQGGGVPVEAVIRNADRAMYRGKHPGRSRVDVSRPPA